MGRLLTVFGILLACLISLWVARKPELQIDIFPPKNRPGEILESTDQSEIEKALHEVDKASDFLELVHVAIGIASTAGKLENPRYFLMDGNIHSTIVKTVETGETSLMLFTKSKVGVVGVKGVVTYEIADSALMLAVMFSNPTVLSEIKFNFKIVEKTTPVDKDLVKHLFDIGAWKTGGYEERKDYGIEITGTMTKNPNSHLIVWIDTSGMDITLPPYRNADCGGAVRDRCWRECDPTGWCRSRQSCKSASDCDGATIQCKDKCKSP